MGTRSNGLRPAKVHGPLTVRGPLSGQAASEALTILAEPQRHNRGSRRHARSLIRRQAKYVRKHVPRADRADRGVTDQLITRAAEMLV